MMVQPHRQSADTAQLSVLPAHSSRQYLILNVIEHAADLLADLEQALGK